MRDSSLPPRIVRNGGSVTARVARLQLDLATRVGDAAWSALHALGAHRWREGYEIGSRARLEPLPRVAMHGLRRALGGLVDRPPRPGAGPVRVAPALVAPTLVAPS